MRTPKNRDKNRTITLKILLGGGKFDNLILIQKKIIKLVLKFKKKYWQIK